MSILLDKPVKRTSMTIWVPRESWMFLQARMQQERMGLELSVNARKRLNQAFTDFSHEGKKQLKDGDLGGCIGSPENAWEAVRVEWDTDGDNEALAFLPEEIELPEGVSDEESISDYISEQTGFCHRGYVLSV